MLHKIEALYGLILTATDGEIGKIKDFYFDDQSWAVRYLVADTGTWLTGRQVLLSPHSLGPLDPSGLSLHVNLTRLRIEASPSIEMHRPVSRQYEEEYYSYYGWPAYWQSSGLLGIGGSAAFPVLVPPAPIADLTRHHGHNQRDDVHLRSTKDITGYQIEATDGPLGKVSGFMLNVNDWTICELMVETGHWFSGKEVLIMPDRVSHISYENSKVFVNLSQSDLKRTKENEIASTVNH